MRRLIQSTMEAMQEAHSQSPSGQDAAPPFLFRDHFDFLKKEEDGTCRFSDSWKRLDFPGRDGGDLG